MRIGTIRGLALVTVCAGFAQTAAADPCVTATFDLPMPGATNVVTRWADVPSSQFPGLWQEGIIGGYFYALFANGEAVLQAARDTPEWAITLMCDETARSCTRAQSGIQAPADAAAIADTLERCFIPPAPAPKAAATPPTAAAPKAAATPPAAAAPKAAVTPPAAEAPKAAATPPVAEAPKAAVTAPVAEAPKAAATPPAAEAPKAAATPPVAEAPNAAVTTPVAEAPKAAVTPPAAEAPKAAVTPPVAVAPKAEVTPPAAAMPQAVFTPSLPCGLQAIPQGPEGITLQRLLVLGGVSPGRLDGYPGKRTRAAMVQLLGPDAWGMPIPEAIAALNTLLCSQCTQLGR